MAHITEIKFLASVPTVDIKTGKIVSQPVLTTIFATGRGPCGKDVISLQAWESSHCLCIKQQTIDGEVKEFMYPWSDIVGRVMVTHGEASNETAIGRD